MKSQFPKIFIQPLLGTITIMHDSHVMRLEYTFEEAKDSAFTKHFLAIRKR